MGEEDGSWVLDSLVNFLRGPVWNVPMLTFIEHKSLIFEADGQDDDAHHKIHEEYKTLVDFMLGSYMEDMGINPEQFEEACGKAAINTPFHQTLFEQVWAADDYEIFKRMMIQKNIELQLQALEIMQQRYGIIPESFMPCDDLPQGEQEVLEQVIKKSLEEHQALQEGMDAETRDMERAMAESKEEKERLELERAREKEMLEKALKLSLSDEPGEVTPSEPLPPFQSTEVSPEELVKRQNYLKAQRDKLLALKQEEREKQLAAFEESAPQKRPKSSRAARKVLDGSTIDPQTLQVRRALAERLKAEVIGEQ
ncbi:cilia- and flagella-associated protein 36 [Procambarus clarkii]|uniref:cilia- and flagella-associated protein 36 n=1 Tax=Procambarus clarkii TaxID=6728 RepID=UPI001E67396F|nr:cilia- and flagella-associated protein 36-like [Procambarus clarkii]